MLCLAASFLFALTSGQQVLPQSHRLAWERASSSVAILEDNGVSIGTAALIDSSGLFLAHKLSITGDRMLGRLRSGRIYSLSLQATDEQTQLVLLKAQSWNEIGSRPLSVASGEAKGSPMIVSLPMGPILGEFSSADRSGVMGPNKRYVPLSEIRFETPQGKIGGALVFDLDGRLVGILNAALEPVPSASSGEVNSVKRDFKGDSRSSALVQKSQYATRGLTVGYALGVDVLQRVVDGFRRPDRQVMHPAIGAIFGDAASPGALIEEVLANSTAQRAGLRVGDIVIKVDDKTILNNLDLATHLFRQKVGNLLKVKVQRGDETIDLNILVGRQTD